MVARCHRTQIGLDLCVRGCELMGNNKKLSGSQISDFIFYVLGILGFLFWIFLDVFEWKYPYCFDYLWCFLKILFRLLPPVILTVVTRNRYKKQKNISGYGFICFLLTILFILPNCIIGIFPALSSRTTNIKNYGKFDSYVNYNEEKFKEFFPGSLPDNYDINYSNLKYFYQCRATFDTTFDVFLEGKLDKNDFNSELNRAKDFFKHQKLLDEKESFVDYEYLEIKKGAFTCLVQFSGAKPFNEVKSNYHYTIFAFDKETLTVRYIISTSYENGVDKPYYLELEW